MHASHVASARVLHLFRVLHLVVMQARLLSVDDDIKPVIQYLESLGLDRAQVKQVRRPLLVVMCSLSGARGPCKLLHDCIVCKSPSCGPASGPPDPRIHPGTAA